MHTCFSRRHYDAHAHYAADQEKGTHKSLMFGHQHTVHHQPTALKGEHIEARGCFTLGESNARFRVSFCYHELACGPQQTIFDQRIEKGLESRTMQRKIA